MLNQCVLVGRIQEVVKEQENTYINLAIPRSFKNSDDIYETDLIKCKLFNSVTDKTLEHLSSNDLLGIRGRIQIIDNIQIVIVDKLTFLSSKNSD